MLHGRARRAAQSSGKCCPEELDAKLKEMGVGKIATVMGRYYAMDRDNRFERVEKAYNWSTAKETATSGAGAMSSYDKGETDEFVLPAVILENGAPVAKISAHDSVIFFNFRPDRAREITRTLVFDDFDGFARKNGSFPLYYVCMTQYDKTFGDRVRGLSSESLDNTFGAYLAEKGVDPTSHRGDGEICARNVLLQRRRGSAKPGEDRALIASPKVATYDLQPEIMSANEVADEAVRRIESGKYDVMILNFANPDMVGAYGRDVGGNGGSPRGGCLRREGCGRDLEDRRTLHHHRRPRQLRKNVGRGRACAVHRAHNEPRALHPRGQHPQGREAAHGRTAERFGADAAAIAWSAGAGWDDRKNADRRLIQPLETLIFRREDVH